MFHLHINQSQQILLAWPGTPAAPVQWSSSLLDSVAVSPQETVNQERAVVTASGSGQAVIIATDGVAVISIIVIAAD